jgi:hypothetical protein
MRVFTLVLLMLLLPLRAWAGDAMALAMLQGPATSHAAVSDTHAGHAPDPAPAHATHDHGHALDHAAHEAVPHGDHPQGAFGTDEHCPTHVACDVCNGPVLTLPAWQADGATVRHRLEVATATPFASLVPHRHHKPPIA